MDARKAALKEGIRQLRKFEIQRLIAHVEAGYPILLDRTDAGHANYTRDNRGDVYCPLAVAVGLPIQPKAMSLFTDEGVAKFLTERCGFKIYNTRGVQGEFYTANRRDDLLVAAREVLSERSDCG
jgi:hypothetical protein